MKKKIFFLAIGLLFMASVAMAAQPECPVDSHYEGEYVEQTTCQNVCTLKLFGVCFRYEQRCNTTGSWVGSCVANPVEEPDEPTDEPTTEPDPETPTASVSGGTPLYILLAGQCREENIEYSPWSECLYNFGLQIRTATPINGCRLTGIQQSNLIKRCGSDNLGL